MRLQKALCSRATAQPVIYSSFDQTCILKVPSKFKQNLLMRVIYQAFTKLTSSISEKQDLAGFCAGEWLSLSLLKIFHEGVNVLATIFRTKSCIGPRTVPVYVLVAASTAKILSSALDDDHRQWWLPPQAFKLNMAGLSARSQSSRNRSHKPGAKASLRVRFRKKEKCCCSKMYLRSQVYQIRGQRRLGS